MATNPREIWLPIYEEIHQHLRESAKKRDQVIAFYLVLLAALIGGWDKLGHLRDTVLIASWGVGLACFVVATQYWRWHIVHNCSMVTLQRLMTGGEEPSIDLCNRTWNQVNNPDTSVWALINPLRGVETSLMYLLAILTFVPSYLLLRGSHLAILHWGSDVWPFLLDAALYSVILVLFSSLFVVRFHKFREQEWPFRWLRDPLPNMLITTKRRRTILTVSKWLLIIAGALLICDSILMFIGIPNPLLGLPLPSPVALLLLGVGLILFGIGGKAFKKQ